MIPDFNQWIKNLGIKTYHEHLPSAEIIIYEALYDLINTKESKIDSK